MDGDIDYSKFERFQLEDALTRIDRIRYPLNYGNLTRELSTRIPSERTNDVPPPNVRLSSNARDVRRYMPEWFSISRVVKFTALLMVTTALAGLVLRYALPLVGVPFLAEGSAHPFWHSLWFAVPVWAVILAVFWMLATRHPEGYWYTATLVALLGNCASYGMLRFEAPIAFHQFGLSGFLNSLYPQGILIVVAAFLSRNASLMRQTGLSTRDPETSVAPNKRLERPVTPKSDAP